MRKISALGMKSTKDLCPKCKGPPTSAKLTIVVILPLPSSFLGDQRTTEYQELKGKFEIILFNLILQRPNFFRALNSRALKIFDSLKD